jgi:hypothetical protein
MLKIIDDDDDGNNNNNNNNNTTFTERRGLVVNSPASYSEGSLGSNIGPETGSSCRFFVVFLRSSRRVPG